jgi:hypothetical protein
VQDFVNRTTTEIFLASMVTAIDGNGSVMIGGVWVWIAGDFSCLPFLCVPPSRLILSSIQPVRTLDHPSLEGAGITERNPLVQLPSPT